MSFYKYENGVFVEDNENFRKLFKKTAITTQNGNVLILKDCYYDKQKNKYCGEHNNHLVEFSPFQIMKIQCVA